MAVYALAADLTAYASADVILPANTDELEALLEEGERMVDRHVGPWPVLSTGRKFDPATLPVTAREALRRATCAAAEFISMLDSEEWIGASDFLPPTLTVLSRAGRVSPKMTEELAGSGLVIWGGTVEPEDPAA